MLSPQTRTPLFEVQICGAENHNDLLFSEDVLILEAHIVKI